MNERGHNLLLYLLATVVGVLAGLVAAAFHYTLDFIERFRSFLRLELADFSTELPFGFIATGWLPLMLCSSAMVCFSLWLVRTFAPEAHGSGIPQVEGRLSGQATLRWWRVLPVKFVGSIAAMSPGLLLGREGPTIHMGAACGQMVADLSGQRHHYSKPLLAAGVASGLAAAFNAPLAGIMLVTEEMRDEFDYNYASLQCVIIASCAAVVVSNTWLGQGLDLSLAITQHPPPLPELPLYVLMGIIVGILAVLYNRCLLLTVHQFERLRPGLLYPAVAAVGAAVGAQLWLLPELVGSGEGLIISMAQDAPALSTVLLLLCLRMLMSVLCYGTGVPGGIFAPLLALGTLTGIGFSVVVSTLPLDLVSTPTMFAIVAMGALFAATVRAPLTGIVLVVELTGALELTLPIIIACLVSTMTAAMLGGRPIYTALRMHEGTRPAA